MSAVRWIALALLVSTVAHGDEVDAILMRARMIMEPSQQIQEAVDLLDTRLEAQPRDKRDWLRLADALAIGRAKSRRAESSLAARLHAAEIDPEDCHLAGLVARQEIEKGPSPVLQRWQTRPTSCAEILYLQSRGDRANEVALLERSRALTPSAEALIALGAARLRANDAKAAEEPYRAALKTSPLFPEDWRMDGWVTVHANLGLAIVYTKLKQPNKARACKKAMHGYLADPGPWHDFSDEEKTWARAALHQELY